jgi:beta-N-acetylhexosaminidase
MKTLSAQINSMFILGYKDENPSKELENLVQQNLGGIIFFAENITNRENFKQIVSHLKSLQDNIITSIDQEGGRVERTKNLPDKIEYIPPLDIINLPIESIKRHYDILAQELLDFGINMNFAPVLDIHSNPNNPVINNRAFGITASDVIKFSKIAKDSMQKSGIMTVGKHFCGHGEAGVDSHLDLPQIDLSMSQLQEHILPFKKAIEDDIDAIMVAHVHFTAFDKEIIPASLSPKVIAYLKNDLGFEGLIISDDMVMGGVTKGYTSLDACIKAIKAGMEMFIFRDTTPEVLQLLEDLQKEAQKDPELLEKISLASAKIDIFKTKIALKSTDFEPIAAKNEIDSIKSTLKMQ